MVVAAAATTLLVLIGRNITPSLAGIELFCFFISFRFWLIFEIVVSNISATGNVHAENQNTFNIFCFAPRSQAVACCAAAAALR